MAMSDAVDISATQRRALLALLAEHLPNVTVWAFGSRVKWTARSNSDLDLVVFSPPEQKRNVADLKEALEESALPFPVDVLVWDEIPDDFKHNIQQKYVVLSERGLRDKWVKTKLGNVVDICYGKDHKTLQDGSIPLYGTGGIMRYVEKAIYNEESILIPRKGSLNNIYYINKPFWTVDTLFWTKINKSIICAKFLYYQLKKINFSALNVGSAVPSLTVNVLNEIDIFLPSIPKQRAVAALLSKFDDKIELNRQMNQTLEQMAQALFKSWFVDFDPVMDNALDLGNAIPELLQGRAQLRQSVRTMDNFKPLPQEIRQLFPNEFEESELGWIPKGWEVSNVGKEFNIIMGQSPLSSTYNQAGEGMPFFQGKTDFGFRFPSNRIYCNDPKRVANRNDTLVSVRAPVGSINLAARKCIIGRGLAAVRHKSGSISFTYYSMNNLSECFNQFEGEGTVFGSINQKDFSALSQLCFPEILTSTFDRYCFCLDEKINLYSLEIETLSKLRDTLLPKLISGELSLADIDLE